MGHEHGRIRRCLSCGAALQGDDSMFDGKHLTGIGETEFLGANQIILTDEFAGLCLMFRAVHGEEDKKFFPNPEEDKQFVEEFKQIPRLG